MELQVLWVFVCLLFLNKYLITSIHPLCIPGQQLIVTFEKDYIR